MSVSLPDSSLLYPISQLHAVQCTQGDTEEMAPSTEQAQIPNSSVIRPIDCNYTRRLSGNV